MDRHVAAEPVGREDGFDAAALTAPELVRSCATRSSAAPTSLISRGASIFGAIGQEVVG